MKRKKEYTYEEYSKLPSEIQAWCIRISGMDGRPSHPEDYVVFAEELLKRANNNQVLANVLFSQVCCLHDNHNCHTAGMYSFLDFWDYIIRRSIISNASLEAYRRGDYMTSEELLEQTRKRLK